MPTTSTTLLTAAAHITTLTDAGTLRPADVAEFAATVRYQAGLVAQMERALDEIVADAQESADVAEEAQDIPAEGASQFSGTTIDSTATPAPQPPPGGDARDALNASVPLSDAPKKPTVGDWLDNTEIALVAAQTVVDVDAIVTSEEVQKALTSLKNGALDRLNAMVRAATDRVAPGVDEGDDFPGDRAAA